MRRTRYLPMQPFAMPPAGMRASSSRSAVFDSRGRGFVHHDSKSIFDGTTTFDTFGARCVTEGETKPESGETTSPLSPRATARSLRKTATMLPASICNRGLPIYTAVGTWAPNPTTWADRPSGGQAFLQNRLRRCCPNGEADGYDAASDFHICFTVDLCFLDRLTGGIFADRNRIMINPQMFGWVISSPLARVPPSAGW